MLKEIRNCKYNCNFQNNTKLFQIILIIKIYIQFTKNEEHNNMK